MGSIKLQNSISKGINFCEMKKNYIDYYISFSLQDPFQGTDKGIEC